MNYSVAAIIPTYNRARTLRRALESVYAQTRRPEEACVVDDGSTDSTEAMIKEHFPQVIYIKQKNRGVSVARNAGVEATTSDCIAFLDSDDEWLPNKIETQLSVLEARPDIRLVHSDEIWIRNGKRVNQMQKHKKSGGYIFPLCLPLCAISPSAVVLHRSLYTAVGGFDESLPACEDYDLWLRICCTEEVLYVDTPLLKKYGGHEDQLSKLYWGMDRFRVEALAKLMCAGNLDAEQEQLARKTLIEKATILKNGAQKRAKRESILYYDALLHRYGSLESEIPHE